MKAHFMNAIDQILDKLDWKDYVKFLWQHKSSDIFEK